MSIVSNIVLCTLTFAKRIDLMLCSYHKKIIITNKDGKGKYFGGLDVYCIGCDDSFMGGYLSPVYPVVYIKYMQLFVW